MHTVGTISNVSIRSPHKSKGRPDHIDGQDAILGVSIRSPHKSKGRLQGVLSVGAAFRRFNPLPSQKQGETPDLGRENHPRRCFNPLPSQKQGETSGSTRGPSKAFVVSIRSPHKSKGRRILSARGRYRLFESRFQSAPLTKARGDNRISPDKTPRRAPQFQSAPLTKARGDSSD